MARKRMLSPEFFRHELLATLPYEARLLYEGLWCHADREGRLRDRPRRIAADVFPFDNVDVDALLEMLRKAGFILRYTVEGERFLAIPTFLKHQRPHIREAPSEIPEPTKAVPLSTNLGSGSPSPRLPESESVTESESESGSESFPESESEAETVSQRQHRLGTRTAERADRDAKLQHLARKAIEVNPKNACMDTLTDSLQYFARPGTVGKKEAERAVRSVMASM